MSSIISLFQLFEPTQIPISICGRKLDEYISGITHILRVRSLGRSKGINCNFYLFYLTNGANFVQK